MLVIGSAPDIGRRRWIEFVDIFLGRPDAPECVQEALAEVRRGSDTDRFALALAALKTEAPKPVSAEITPTSEIRANGFLLATVSYPKSGPRISFTKAVPTSFVDFSMIAWRRYTASSCNP
jgi:ParB family chromosome partitioning protein